MMNITKHAGHRMRQRGVNAKVAKIMEEIIPAVYINHSQQITLTRKEARHFSKELRRYADLIERHQGTTLVLSDDGDSLITAYRK